MKKLITAEDVKKAKSNGEDIYIDKSTIVTAQARDVARDLEVNIVLDEGLHQYRQSNNEPFEDKKQTPCDKEVRCCGKKEICDESLRCCEKALSADEIYKVLSFALEAGIVSESDLQKML